MAITQKLETNKPANLLNVMTFDDLQRLDDIEAWFFERFNLQGDQHKLVHQRANGPELIYYNDSFFNYSNMITNYNLQSYLDKNNNYHHVDYVTFELSPIEEGKKMFLMFNKMGQLNYCDTKNPEYTEPFRFGHKYTDEQIKQLSEE